MSSPFERPAPARLPPIPRAFRRLVLWIVAAIFFAFIVIPWLASFVTDWLWFKEIGISDKYIQQTETDQEVAFQKAFTLNLAYSSLFFLLALAAVPVFAAMYGQPRMIAPGSLNWLGSPLGQR